MSYVHQNTALKGTQLAHTLAGELASKGTAVANSHGLEGTIQPAGLMSTAPHVSQAVYDEKAAEKLKEARKGRCSANDDTCKGFALKTTDPPLCAGHAGVIGGRKNGAGKKAK